ncbi:MAG: RidA family protein [Xanthobacteraceae bacterium]|nr:RidA family protein [Xanthobacteraceae bacterium]
MTVLRIAAAILIAALATTPASAAERLEGTPRMKERAYSPAVITEGGRIVWLAGMGGSRAADGSTIKTFGEQARQAFREIDATLKRVGGTLANVVTMTVFIRHQSDGDEFVKVRAETFKSGFPASALITASDFARPEILVEIQAVAVIGERN